MATLAPQTITNAGLNATYASAASGGDEFVNNERTLFHVKNGDASSKTVTIAKQRASVRPADGMGAIPVSDIAVTIPAGEERFIAAPPALYNDNAGKAQVTYDAVTSVTVAVIVRADD